MVTRRAAIDFGLTAYMRLAGSLDQRLVIWWLDGIRYGVVDARCRPLYGMKVGMFQRFERTVGGAYRFAILELTYYTDLATGELLEDYRNPYTSESNRVVHVRLGPSVRIQTGTGTTVPSDPSIKDYESRLGPVIVNGDHVWIMGDVTARIVLPFPKAPEIVLNHYTTVGGLARDALDASVISAPATLSFQNVIRWEPWMRMGEHPGHLMSRAVGRKLEAVDELPPDYLSMAQRLHPEFIADPRAILERTLAAPAHTENTG